jgi:Domain of unknown function (DUF382)
MRSRRSLRSCGATAEPAEPAEPEPSLPSAEAAAAASAAAKGDGVTNYVHPDVIGEDLAPPTAEDAASFAASADAYAHGALQRAKAAALVSLADAVGPEGNHNNEATLKGKRVKRGRRRRQRLQMVAEGGREDKKDEKEERESIAVNYVPAEVQARGEFAELAGVFERFAAAGQGEAEDDDDPGVDAGAGEKNAANANAAEQHEGDVIKGVDDKTDETKVESSERQRRLRNRMSIAELKSRVPNPGVVEQWDVTAADPLLLVHLKSLPDSVPVPSNWRQKRKYLQSKRGMEKLAFKLPSYIEDTGISVERAAAAEADASKTSKQKGRDRLRSKAGKGVEIRLT